MKSVINQLAKCDEFGSKFEVDDSFWTEVEEIISVLQPGYDMTISMQKVGYGLSDFYISWWRVKKNVERIIKAKPRFDLAQNLIDNMDLRAPSLFNTPLFLCAVYLDPRVMFSLSVDQRTTAAMELIKLHDRAKESNNNTKHDMDNTLDEIASELDRQNTHNLNGNLHQEISIYECETRFDLKESVMKFWVQNTHKYPLLRPLADMLHAVPSNQCCTERSFSSFSYIRSKLRMSMNPKNVSNVLMVRLNKDIYYMLREKRVRQILNEL